MNCEYCGLETEGVRGENGQQWPLCSACMAETWARLREEDARARAAQTQEANCD